MKKLYDIRLRIYAIILPISAIIERFVKNFIDDRVKLGNILSFALSLFLLVLLFFIFDIALKYIVNSKLLTKAIYGKQYVGGRWIEIIREEKNNTIIYCDLHIIYKKDKTYILGTSYNGDFSYRNTFETEVSFIDNYNLSYLYESAVGDKLNLGVGYVNFRKNSNAPPNWFFSYFSEYKKYFKGEGRLISRNEAKKLDIDFKPAFKELIHDLEAQTAL